MIKKVPIIRINGNDEVEIEVFIDEVRTSREGWYYGKGTFEYKGTRKWRDSENGISFTKKGLSKEEIDALTEALESDSFTGYTPNNVGQSRWIYVSF